MRFRRKALPGYRDTSEPTAGTLREPITLYRSARAPTDNGAFTQTLTAYHPCFADYDPAPERKLHGQNADATATSLFTIRWDKRLCVETRDYVQFQNRFFKVAFTKVKGKFSDWLDIFCNEHFEADNSERLVIAPVKSDPPQDVSSNNNTGWNLPAE